MFIELVDTLRCLNDHEESWLVAAVERFEGRYIDRGSLGCPVCRAQYGIERGVADFRRPGDGSARDAQVLSAVEDTGLPLARERRTEEGPAEEVLRIRALLDLSAAGGTIVLAGQSAALAAPLEDEIDVNVLVVNPGTATAQHPGRSTLLVSDRIPLARGSLRGAVIGDDQATQVMLGGLAGALRVGGRLVAPAAAGIPFGVELLARDDRQWVAIKRDATSAPVSLGLRRS